MSDRPALEAVVHENLEDLYENAPCGYLSTLTDGTIVRVNQTFLALTGYRRADLLGVQRFEDLLDDAHRTGYATRYRPDVELLGEVRGFPLALRTADGAALPVVAGSALRPGRGAEPTLIRTTVVDARAQHAQERELLHQRRRAALAEADSAAVLNTSLDAIVITDAGGTVEHWNPAAERIFGWTAAETVGRPVSDLIVPPELRTAHEQGIRTLDPTMSRVLGQRLELEAVHRNGTRFPIEMTVTRSETEGRVIFVGYLRDLRAQVELRRALEVERSHLEALARRDPLTGLLNRTGLTEELERALTDGARRAGGVALLSIDLDDFKDINDSLGHAVGDDLLVHLGRRLVDVLPAGTPIARHGGDEFLVVLARSGPDAVPAGTAAQSLLVAMTAPVAVGDLELDVSASIGVSLYPDDAGSAGELLAHADAAIHRAKKQGGFRVVHYCPETDDPRRRLALTTQLRRAIADAAIDVHYQPIVDLDTGKVTKVEALARWNDPDEGPVSPAAFIPLAEASRQINGLGDVVLERVVSQLVAWDATGAPPISAAINISPVQLRHDRLLATIDAALQRHRLPAGRLAVELTESAVLEDFARTTALIRELRERGISVAIDDFGTGHSSLARLRDLPVDIVKLDRSFIAPLPERQAGALVDTFLSLARRLSLSTVAEGIETPTQCRYLMKAGCDAGQGFLFGKPMPAEDLTLWLGSHAGVVPLPRPGR